MANTVIQLKYSTVTSSPTSLNVGEPAYSYTSNVFYIGSPDSAGAIAIGGQYYVNQQGLIYTHANAAFDAANNAVDTFVRGQANAAFDHANAAFDSANTNATAITVLQGVDVTQNTSISNLEGVNLTQNTNITNAQGSADAAFDHANASFDLANTAITTSGGTITGALNVSSNVWIGGNLIVQGTQTIVDSTIVQVADNIITLNAAIDQASAPVLDAGIEIDRGSSANVFVKWNETSDKWTVTNDGSNYFNIGADTGEIYANAAFDAANTAQGTADASFLHANASFEAANTNATAITALQGVDLTQNTNITAAQASADAAFLHANAAFDVANTDVTNVNISTGHFGSATEVAAFQVAANGRVISANATSIAISATQITSGTLPVGRGGTGATTFTTNGVLLGQGTSALTTASSSTEGHILTINSSGVPEFKYLQGGTF